MTCQILITIQDDLQGSCIDLPFSLHPRSSGPWRMEHYKSRTDQGSKSAPNKSHFMIYSHTVPYHPSFSFTSSLSCH